MTSCAVSEGQSNELSGGQNPIGSHTARGSPWAQLLGSSEWIHEEILGDEYARSDRGEGKNVLKDGMGARSSKRDA